MSKNPWLLPDGIDEIVGDDARILEALRRELLDLFDTWGYELVVPPIVEFTDSLLTGLGEKLDLQTFKFRDQSSGKSLGVRADISTQAARIDAHSMQRQGANRLCYAGTVLRSSVDGAFQSRAPKQIGAELFGVDEIDADIEIISLMLATLQSVTQRDITLEISHQGVMSWLQQLAENASLNFEALFALVSEKRLPELDAFLAASDLDSVTCSKLSQLPRLMGGADTLDVARKLFSQDAIMVSAIDDMLFLAQRLSTQYPEVELFFNLSEIQISDYHSGVLFSAYAEVDEVVIKAANGGRYNEVGGAFGRPRPATGFSACLKMLARLFDVDMAGISSKAVYAAVPAQPDKNFWNQIEDLRGQGYRVQLGYPSCTPYMTETGCSLQLVEQDGTWLLEDIS